MPKIIQGFTLREAPAYDPRYLAGWPAEVYEVAMSDASLEARKQAVLRVRALIRSDVGYVKDLNYSTASISVTSFKLVLIPLWVTQYVMEGRPYRVLINGQTGAVYGEKPSRGVMGWLGDVLGGE
jgi:hypothetical protein